MSTWSRKRQLSYLAIPLVLVTVFSTYVYSKYIYTPATCFDGLKNGSETGQDCGGSCQLVCSADTLAPVVLWAKSFNVTGDVWNTVAYVQNPNTQSSARNVSYEFKLYDQSNNLIISRTGQINIPKNRTFTVFEGGINVGDNIIKRTEFTFSGAIQWFKSVAIEPELTITNNPIESGSTTPKIKGTVLNSNLQTIGSTELVALIFDGRGNVIGASKTVVDYLPKGQSAPFVFTWPHPFPVGKDVCQASSEVMLVLDRSGSMASISQDPPQPLTDVKKIAVDFISQLKPEDYVGVVSFGTTATNHVPDGLTSNLDLAKIAIQDITISSSTVDQNTNIGEGLILATNKLLSMQNDKSADVKKIIILLTDGVPTEPKKWTEPENPEGQSVEIKNYPTLYAEDAASSARSKNINIYAIGLGQEASTDILFSIAGSQDRFFSAPNTTTLSSIYNSIGSSICSRKPNVIVILSRIL